MVKTDRAVLVLLGQRIRARRLSKGWSQEELADRAKLDRSYIGGIERGERNITVLKLCQVASPLVLDPGVLLQGIRGARSL